MVSRNHHGVLLAVVATVVAAAALTAAWSTGLWNRSERNRPSTTPAPFGVVPNVKYLLLGAAEQRVSAAGLTWNDALSSGGANFSFPCHPAEIFGQSPAAGTKVRTGTRVTLIGGPGSLPRLHGSCTAYVTNDVATYFAPQPPVMQWSHTVLMLPMHTPLGVRLPLPYSTTVTAAELRISGPLNSITCRDGVCWALGTVDGFEYPLFSTDGGSTWRTGGHWFTIPAADAGSFVSTIKILTTGVVAAYGSGNSFYVTGNSGLTWFGTSDLGNVIVAKYPVVVRGGDFFEVTTASYYNSNERRYVASMFARSAPTFWKLISDSQ
jgi:hypothetical protein